MKHFGTTYRKLSGLLIGILALLWIQGTPAFAQTPSGTQISTQGTGSFNYKKKPYSIVSPIVTVTVGSFPNFEMHYAVRDSNVIFDDVVQLWLSFTNIGNAAADTVTIQSVMPASGVTIVSASGGGTVNGSSITWKVFNDAVAKQDSFLIQLKIDTTTKAQTVLSASALLSWQGKSITAAQNLVVGNFARLTLTDTTTAPVVGSGRLIDYQLVVSNTGNVQSDSTILVDSISINGTFDHASVVPTSVSPDKRILTWFLGTLQAITGQAKINLTVQTPPNLGYMRVKNAASAHSSNVSLVTAPTITTTIVPVRPAAIQVAARQKYIFGAVNQDSSQIVAAVSDSLGNPIPDGVPVVFTTNLGSFYVGGNTFTAATTGGKASAYLLAASVTNDIKIASVSVVAGVAQSGLITGNASVTMYPGAVTGVVRTTVNNAGVISLRPYQGAVARVFDSAPRLVGSDTTESDGIFFIALNKQVTSYTLQISVIDQFGDSSTTISGMTSDTLFGRKAVKILNTIAGRLQYQSGNTPIPIKGVEVFLDSLAPGQAPAARMAKGVGGQMFARRIQSTTTDELGRYKFQNLQPAVYQISVDSTKFPVYSGVTTLYDTSGGTFAINLNILVRPNATANMTMSALPTIFAGDSIRYSMKFVNQGNISHTNVVMQDSLPPFTSLIGAQRGRFTAMAFDTAKRVLRWSLDTMAVGMNDSVSMTLGVVRNVPDSTYIHNDSWFGSDQLSPFRSGTVTLVRSAPQMALKNLVLENRDTVMAGDSVKFEIWYRNSGTDSLRHVQILDSLFNGGRSIVRFQQWTGGVPGKDTTAVDSVITWNIGSIPPGSVDSLTLFVKTDYALAAGRKIQTTAYLLQNGAQVASAFASVHIRSNPQIATFLQVVKSANKNVAEIGDVVTYQVAVTNNSAELMKDLTLIDQLPHAFKYYPGSGRYNNARVEPQKLSNGTVLKWALSSAGRDTLKAANTGTLVYQLVLGADALESQGINTIYATAKDTVGTLFVSAPSQKQITVQPGVFTDQGIIVGKIFYDDDRNAYQSEGESGVKGVEIWMEDGTRIITGDDGKYSLPNVNPGQHVLRVNERSLPPGAELIKGGRDFAGDASSRFVRLTEGGIARANFFVKRILRDSVHQKVGKIAKTAAMRTAFPEHLYLRDTPRGSSTSNLVGFSIGTNYSGGTYLQRIRIFDDVPSGFTYVEGSGLFNGRKVTPMISGNHLAWNLGRGAAIFDGRLQYQVSVARPELQASGLESRSVVELMTADSVIIQSDTLRTTTSVQKLSYIEKRFPVEPLVFNPGKSTLRKDALKIFQPAVDLIKQHRWADIMLVGYPDMPVKRGTAVSIARDLAEARARVALDFLSRRMNLDSVHITACSVFRCDTSKELLASLMDGSRAAGGVHHLELRIRDYFQDALVTRDTNASVSAISLIRTPPQLEREFQDSIFTIPGDDVMFSCGIFSNPAGATLQASVIDSTAAGFAISGGSLTLNHVPVISAGEFNGVISSSITPLIKRGKNEMQLQAAIPAQAVDERLVHVFYFQRMNAFGETSVERSNPVTVYVRGKNLSLLDRALKQEKEYTGIRSTSKPTTSK